MSSGLDFKFVCEYMIMSVFKLNITEILTYISNSKSRNAKESETEILERESIEKVYSILIKFSRLKQIDETLDVERDDDQFEEFKAICNKIAEEEEKIANIYLPNKMASI